MLKRLFHLVATGPRRRRTLLTPVGLSVFGLSLLVVIAGGIATDRLLEVPQIPQGLLWSAAGTVLLVTGAGICAWCVVLFAKARGTPVPINPPDTLIVQGPYRYSRNPMLTSVFLMLFGTGVMLHSTSMVAVWVPAYIVAHALELLLVEEPELEQRLGKTYIEYKKRVPMFYPRLWRRGMS